MEKKQLRPPYASSGQADALLDLFRRVSPKKIDSKFIVENSIATATNAFTVVDTAKWFGIIDEDGNVNETIVSKLKLVGQERDNYIQSIIEKSYKTLLERVNLKEARKDDITNFFVHEYKFGSAQAKYAAALFLHLCQKYGIELAEELKKKTHIPGRPKSNNQKTEKKSKGKSVSSIESIEWQGTEVITNEGEIVLHIYGNGLNKKIGAKNKEELQEIYEGKFKDFIEAAKLLFPEEKEVDE